MPRGRRMRSTVAFCRLQKKLGRKVHLGAFRKSWATEALKNGVDPVTAAHLLGHRDTSMIARTYAKVQQDPQYMRDAMKRAKGGGGSSPRSPSSTEGSSTSAPSGSPSPRRREERRRPDHREPPARAQQHEHAREGLRPPRPGSEVPARCRKAGDRPVGEEADPLDWCDYLTLNQRVVGSSPTGGT